MFRWRQTRGCALCYLSLLLIVGCLSAIAGAVTTSETTHVITLRADSPERKIGPHDVHLSLAGQQANLVSVLDSSETELNLALVIDAGPDQFAVLDREKQLASGLLDQFAGSGAGFIVIRAGRQARIVADTFETRVAIASVQVLATDTGKKSLIPLYNALALAIDALSSRPGIPVLVVVAEGNAFRSAVGYKQLRASAQAQHVSVATALVANHSTRGSKAILSYGWDLQSLAGDTAGIFIDNDRNTARVVSRLTRMIGSLRLVTFEAAHLSAGRYRVSVSARSAGRIHAQKAIVIRDPSQMLGGINVNEARTPNSISTAKRESYSGGGHTSNSRHLRRLLARLEQRSW